MAEFIVCLSRVFCVCFVFVRLGLEFRSVVGKRSVRGGALRKGEIKAELIRGCWRLTMIAAFEPDPDARVRLRGVAAER